ncbi:hypothetical protein EDC04DRAFT_2613446, partial [Pisolithus marmoratus]
MYLGLGGGLPQEDNNSKAQESVPMKDKKKTYLKFIHKHYTLGRLSNTIQTCMPAKASTAQSIKSEVLCWPAQAGTDTSKPNAIDSKLAYTRKHRLASNAPPILTMCWPGTSQREGNHPCHAQLQPAHDEDSTCKHNSWDNMTLNRSLNNEIAMVNLLELACMREDDLVTTGQDNKCQSVGAKHDNRCQPSAMTDASRVRFGKKWHNELKLVREYVQCTKNIWVCIAKAPNRGGKEGWTHKQWKKEAKEGNGRKKHAVVHLLYTH